MSGHTCPSCGSINTRVRKGSPFERLLSALLGKANVACQRCKWQGRLSRPNGDKSRRRVRTETVSPSGRKPAPVDLDALDRGLSGDVKHGEDGGT